METIVRNITIETITLSNKFPINNTPFLLYINQRREANRPSITFYLQKYYIIIDRISQFTNCLQSTSLGVLFLFYKGDEKEWLKST